MRPVGQSTILLLLLLLFLLACLRPLPEVNAVYFGSCSAPLGLESGGIPDKDISASSAYDAASVGPQHGRLRHDKNGGAWCPRHMVTRDAVEFLEVNLGSVHAVTGTQTQGRFGNGQGQEYAEEFLIDYWRPGLVKWRRWRGRDGKQTLAGNTNTYLVEEQKLDPVLLASKVRFVPYSVHVRTVCMRVEILGCPWKGGLISYSMPQGLVRGDVDLRDALYDGREEGMRLTGGLGNLVDGHKGNDNFHVEVYGPGKGVGWVGWRNDTAALAGQPVDIIFEFDRVRNFSAIYLHTNNLYSKEVQVFSQAKVYFSVNSGRQFSGEPVQFSYMPDLVMEHARNVTVKLHHRIGRYLKLQLYFASRWLLLSEVSFDSVVVHGNVTEEEVDNSLLPGLQQPADAGTVAYQPKEDTPQRDEFHHTTPTRDQHRKTVVSDQTSTGTKKDEPEPTVIGLVIGALSVVIVLLMAAIAFIVVKNRKQKSSSTHSGLPGHFGPEKSVTINMKELQMRVNVNAKGGHHVYGQVSMEEPPLGGGEKGAGGGGGMYHEPFSNMYSCALPPQGVLPPQAQGHRMVGSDGHFGVPPSRLTAPEYTDVRDMTSQEYAVPHMATPASFNNHVTPQTPVRPQPPTLHNLFPKPPPVPPPPEKYYAATEICQTAPPVPLSPPPSAPPSCSSQGSSSMYGHLQMQSPPHPPASLHPLPPLSSPSSDGGGGVGGVGVGELFKYPTMQLHEFPRDQIRLLHRLGVGQFGEVQLGEITKEPDWLNDLSCKLVAVKYLRSGASEATRSEFRQEVEILNGLRDSNLVQVIGACLRDDPFCVIFEYSEFGDLNQFLQEHIAETATPLPANAKTLSYGCLIYMATQIASGMKYLESRKFVHRDVATRNCLVGRGYTIKISDFGMGRSLYSADYYDLDGREALPIRWMAWESILLGKFTTKSDVWSFAVALWEVLTFAREQPFEDLGDERVIENVTHFYQGNGKQLLLPQPINCPKEIYDLMCECWQRNEADRPNFREIHLFLQRKNLGYRPELK